MSLALIDTHLHLDLLDEPAGAAATAIKSAADVGVVGMLAVGVDPRTPAVPEGVAALLPRGVRRAVGLHPQTLPDLSDDDVEAALEQLERMLTAGGVAAVGETGLDARPGIGDSDEALARQVGVFRRHLGLARHAGLPLILHAVRRDGALFDVLDDDIDKRGPLPPMLWHAYSASRDTLREALRRGMHVAVGGLVRNERARRLREAVPHIPAERLLLETDAPPLAPAALLEVARATAVLRGQGLEALAAQTTENAVRLLGF